MTAAILADTGPLYALADTSDQYHGRAATEMQSIERRGLMIAVSHGVLCEAHTLILRRLGGKYARQWLAQVLDGVTVVGVERGDVALAAAMLDRFPDQPITLVDGLLAVLCRRLATPVWTFDRDLMLLGARIFR